MGKRSTFLELEFVKIESVRYSTVSSLDFLFFSHQIIELTLCAETNLKSKTEKTTLSGNIVVEGTLE